VDFLLVPNLNLSATGSGLQGLVLHTAMRINEAHLEQGDNNQRGYNSGGRAREKCWWKFGTEAVEKGVPTTNSLPITDSQLPHPHAALRGRFSRSLSPQPIQAGEPAKHR
jgi:hypothetical protein